MRDLAFLAFKLAGLYVILSGLNNLTTALTFAFQLNRPVSNSISMALPFLIPLALYFLVGIYLWRQARDAAARLFPQDEQAHSLSLDGLESLGLTLMGIWAFLVGLAALPLFVLNLLAQVGKEDLAGLYRGMGQLLYAAVMTGAGLWLMQAGKGINWLADKLRKPDA